MEFDSQLRILAVIEIGKMKIISKEFTDFCDFASFFHEISKVIDIQLFHWSQTDIN